MSAGAGSRPKTVGSFTCVGLRRHYRVPTGRWWRQQQHGIRRALDGVDLAMAPDRHLAIIGESGSGKSTLLRLLLGLEAPDAGTVSFRGREVVPGPSGTLTWLRREVQLVSQDPGSSLNPRLSVAESIREPLECLRLDGDHRARVRELLTAVGLDPAAGSRRPAAFSGGERQRVAIARALAPRPSVLLADEPFSAVDAATRVQLVALIQDLTASEGLQLLLVSHDLGVVERLCHDVVVMEAGTVAETGPVGRVFGAPQAELTRRLLAAVPRLPAPDVALTAETGP